MPFDVFATNALINALRSGDVQRMRSALQAGADPDASASDQPLVCFAAYADICGDDALGVLLHAGANPNQPDRCHSQPDVWALSALSFAIIKRKWRRADMLLKHGADVNFQQQKGASMTTLFHAIRVDLMHGEATRTACVLSFKPDVSAEMHAHDALPTACTVVEYLLYRQQQEPDKHAAISTLLRMIAHHVATIAAEAGHAGRDQDRSAAVTEEQAPHMRETAIAHLKQRANSQKRRFKL